MTNSNDYVDPNDPQFQHSGGVDVVNEPEEKNLYPKTMLKCILTFFILFAFISFFVSILAH